MTSAEGVRSALASHRMLSQMQYVILDRQYSPVCREDLDLYLNWEPPTVDSCLIANDDAAYEWASEMRSRYRTNAIGRVEETRLNAPAQMVIIVLEPDGQVTAECVAFINDCQPTLLDREKNWAVSGSVII